MGCRYLVFLGLLAVGSGAHAAALGTEFTYQGELRVSSQPANGAYDFQIALFDLLAGGVALDTSLHGDVAVAQGLFSVLLDYTSVPFASSSQYYLEVRVRDGASTGAYTTLLPRQAINATPYALHAQSVSVSAIAGAPPARPEGVTRSYSLPGGSPTTTAGDSSITIGVDGLPIASVFDAANGNLVAVHCDDPACAALTSTVLDSTGIVGRGNSIIVLTNGLPAISYIDSTNGDLKLARCTNRACTSATLAVVDAAVGDSRRSVIMQGIGATGEVDIVYHDEIQGDLEGASCPTTGTCTLVTIDSANNVGHSLDAMRMATRIYIAYSDQSSGSMVMKSCSTFIGNCASSIAVPVDTLAAPSDIALVALPDARPLMLYVRGIDLRSARCTTSACTAVTAAGSPLATGTSYVAATLGGDDLPILFYINNDFSVGRFYKCLDYDCGSILAGGSYGSGVGVSDARIGITLGSHGNPVASHRLANSLWLRVCDNPECAIARRR